MLTRILASWLKFDKHYKLTDDTAVYAASILLHPELRRVYLGITRSCTLSLRLEPCGRHGGSTLNQRLPPHRLWTLIQSMIPLEDDS
jgi:hypothetical protein